MFGERLFGLDAQTLFDAFIVAVNMLILFAFLSYFMFNPIRALLKKRQDRITGDREQAENDKAAAEKLKKEYDARIKDIEKDAELILSEARKKALKNEERIVDEAKEEAARIIAHAKTEAELEKKKAADNIKKEIIAVATLMAGKVAAASVDETTQNALVEETLKEIGEETWLS
ncbi:MAG: F0F1 ATP synthase subunit B [Lachnospiraceae bacterium]|nr:F0F1 ATP synthase subunit B [Lachnospiraceae bacterium]